jgi:hypothetical protein
LAFTLARICRRAPLTIGVAAIAAGMLTVACGSNGTTAPTTSTTTTTTTTTSSATSSGGGGGGHHEKHDSGGGGAAPADTGAPSTVTVDPGTVTNTETDIQTTVQTSTQTVTATPTFQQRDQNPRNDNNGNRSQSGSQ